MIESIIVYTITALLLYLCGRNIAVIDAQCIISKRDSLKKKLSYIVAVGLFTLIAACRYDVGVDYLSYLSNLTDYNYYHTFERDSIESAFKWIVMLCSYMGVHFSIYFGIFALLQIGLIYYAFRNRSFLLPYIGLYIMLGPFFLNWMNGMRQCVVMCAFIAIVPLIQQRKLFSYIIAILCLSLMHRSVLLLLPIYFVYKIQTPHNKRFLLLIILMFCVILGVTPFWIDSLSSFKDLLSVIGYNAYSDSLNDMISSGLRKTDWGPSRLTIFIVEVLIIWNYSNISEFFKKDVLLPIYFTLFYLGVCLYNLFVNTSHIFLRPIEYFQIFSLPLFAYTAYYLYKNKKLMMLIFISVSAYMYIYITIIKSTLINDHLLQKNLYKFFFQ